MAWCSLRPSSKPKAQGTKHICVGLWGYVWNNKGYYHVSCLFLDWMYVEQEIGQKFRYFLKMISTCYANLTLCLVWSTDGVWKVNCCWNSVCVQLNAVNIYTKSAKWTMLKTSSWIFCSLKSSAGNVCYVWHIRIRYTVHVATNLLEKPIDHLNY